MLLQPKRISGLLARGLQYVATHACSTIECMTGAMHAHGYRFVLLMTLMAKYASKRELHCFRRRLMKNLSYSKQCTMQRCIKRITGYCFIPGKTDNAACQKAQPELL